MTRGSAHIATNGSKASSIQDAVEPRRSICIIYGSYSDSRKHDPTISGRFRRQHRAFLMQCAIRHLSSFHSTTEPR